MGEPLNIMTLDFELNDAKRLQSDRGLAPGPPNITAFAFHIDDSLYDHDNISRCLEHLLGVVATVTDEAR